MKSFAFWFSVFGFLLSPLQCIDSTAVGAEKLALVYDTGRAPANAGVLDMAREFKALPNAEHFVIVSGSFMGSLSAVHSPFYMDESGPIACGGWLGCEKYAPTLTPLLPLKPVMGEHAQPGVAGDSAGIWAQYRWCWNSCLAGTCSLNTTYREKNNYFNQKVEVGPASKAYLLDFRQVLATYYTSTVSGGVPLTTGPGFGYADLALGRYKQDFSIANASPKWKDHKGVGSSGAATWVRGLYHKSGTGFEKTKQLVELVRDKVGPAAWLVDWSAGTAAITATQSLVGSSNVYPVVAVTMDGTIEHPNGTVEPAMTPSEFVAWLNSVEFSEVVIASQADSVAVCDALALLLPAS